MNRGALVVYGWAAFNGLLAVVLVIYSYRDPFPLIVYSGALLLLGTFGTAVLLAGRDELAPETYRIATRSTSAGFLAAAVALIGLGTVYGLWIMLIALYPLLLAAVLVRREREPDRVPDRVLVLASGPGPPAEPDEQPASGTDRMPGSRARSVAVALGVLVVGVRVVAALWRARRRRRGRR